MMRTPVGWHSANGGSLLFGAALIAFGLFILVPSPVAGQPRKQQPAVAAPSAGPPPKQEPAVARVNEQDIRLSEVFDSIKSLSLGDQIDARGALDTYIEAMIKEEVLFQWALRNNFDGNKKLRTQIKDLVVRALFEKYVASRIRVGDAEVRSYFDNNPSLVRGEHVRVRRILLGKRADCVRMLRRIDSEKAFIELAKAYSLERETAAKGGDSGFIMRGEGRRIGYEMEYFKMKVGEVRIFDLPQGCMIVRLTLYLNPPSPPFEVVKKNLRQFLENRREIRLLDKLFKKALVGMKIQRNFSTAEQQ